MKITAKDTKGTFRLPVMPRARFPYTKDRIPAEDNHASRLTPVLPLFFSLTSLLTMELAKEAENLFF